MKNLEDAESGRALHGLRGDPGDCADRESLGRRHSPFIAAELHRQLSENWSYTKSARAYVAAPYFSDALKEARERRAENLKKVISASKCRSSTQWTFSEMGSKKRGKSTFAPGDLAASIGVGRSLLFGAVEIHRLLEQRPQLRAEIEPKILRGEMSLSEGLEIAKRVARMESAAMIVATLGAV